MQTQNNLRRPKMTRSCLVVILVFSTATVLLAQNPIAYYPFNGNANDTSGNGTNGTVSGAILTTDRFGTPNSAYLFATNTDRITLPAGSIGMTTSTVRTISVWVKPTSVAVAPNDGGIISQYLHGSPSVSNFFVQLNQSTGVYSINVTGNGTDLLTVPLPSNPTGQWLHLVIVLKAGTNNTMVYVNNSLAGSGTVTYNTVASSNSPVIGDIDGGQNVDNFRGAIDDIRIYNRVLSIAEIATLFQESVNQGLVAYYPFNGNAKDSSGNGNNGTVFGATLASDRFGNPNGAFQFDTSQASYIRIRDSSSLDPQTISICVWVYYQGGSNNPRIFSKWQSGVGDGYSLFQQTQGAVGQTGAMAQFLTNSHVATTFPISPNFTSNTWEFFVVQRDVDSVRIYGNAQPILSSYFPGSLINTNGPLVFGVNGGTIGTGQDYLKGKLDDIRIYNRVLNAAEINSLYKEGGWTPTDVEEHTVDGIPHDFQLSQNYPNPFNPTTTIRFSIAHRGRVSLKIFDILGREVATLVNGELEAGLHQATFDASKLTSGVYLYRINTGSNTETKKLVLLK